MSLNLDMTTKVWLSALPKGINKLVLLCFCQHLNDISALSWPSISRVARMCGMSERTVQCHVRALQRAGILLARLRIGRTTQYSIDLSSLAPLQFSTAPDLFEPVDNSAVDNSTPAVYASNCADSGMPPPQIAAFIPANPAPELSLTSKSTIRTAAPALPATPMMMIDGVSPEVLKDFAAVRKSKRAAPLTPTAIDSLRTEAALAGLTVEQALVTCCKRGWARFEAAWLLDGRSTPAALSLVTVAAKPASPPPAPAKLAAPEVAEAGRQRLSLIRQTPPAPVVGIQIGATGPGWAHRIVNRHKAGERVSHASLREACTALRIAPASLAAARLH